MTAFPEIQKIRYEGPQSKKALSFRHYNEAEVVAGKTMKDHLRFSVAYWHAMRGTRLGPLRPRHDAPSLGNRLRRRRPWPRSGSAWPSSSWRS